MTEDLRAALFRALGEPIGRTLDIGGSTTKLEALVRIGEQINRGAPAS